MKKDPKALPSFESPDYLDLAAHAALYDRRTITPRITNPPSHKTEGWHPYLGSGKSKPKDLLYLFCADDFGDGSIFKVGVAVAEFHVPVHGLKIGSYPDLLRLYYVRRPFPAGPKRQPAYWQPLFRSDRRIGTLCAVFFGKKDDPLVASHDNNSLRLARALLEEGTSTESSMPYQLFPTELWTKHDVTYFKRDEANA